MIWDSTKVCQQADVRHVLHISGEASRTAMATTPSGHLISHIRLSKARCLSIGPPFHKQTPPPNPAGLQTPELPNPGHPLFSGICILVEICAGCGDVDQVPIGLEFRLSGGIIGEKKFAC